MNELLSWIVFIFISVTPWCLVYLMIRNSRVSTFRLKLIEIAHIWSINYESYEPSDWAFYWFLDEIPTYNNMVYSFKRLKLKNWCTQEQLDKLLADPEVKQRAEELNVL